MEPANCDTVTQRDETQPAKKPWVAPKVIVSQAVARGGFGKTNNTIGDPENHSPGTIATS